MVLQDKQRLQGKLRRLRLHRPARSQRRKNKKRSAGKYRKLACCSCAISLVI